MRNSPHNKMNLNVNCTVSIVLLGLFTIGLGHPGAVGTGQHFPGFTKIGQWQSQSEPTALTYHVSDYLAPQMQALTDCEQIGGRLATILETSQYETVLNSLNEAGIINSMLWIAGQHDGSKWIWLTTGEEIELFFWAASYPVDSTHHGLTILVYVGNSGYGDSFGVNSHRRFICEISES